MGSKRLPGKVLHDLSGLPVLAWVARAARAVPGIDNVAVATSDTPQDDAIASWCAGNAVACHRGSENDVLARFAFAARQERSTYVMRLTADCPLLDPQVCATVLQLLLRSGADYASNCDPATWPDGLDCEVFTAAALFEAEREAKRPSEREHVTPFLRHNRHRYRVEAFICPLPGLSGERWTLDEPADLEFLSRLAAALPQDCPASYTEVLDVLAKTPELGNINRQIMRNEGFAKSITQEPLSPERYYETSTAFLDRARKSIPLGSQTFSKCHIQYPQARAPQFLSHGDGGRVWDIDGNEYVDLVAGLLPVVLGYRHPTVDEAIRHQLSQGISFSLATTLETELAERLVDIIPCAEAVRYGKNGSDATTGAIRLARAFTRRDRVMLCGYHGWHDWYIGTTSRDLGVPAPVGALSEIVPYGNLDAVRTALANRPCEYAALILEPMNVTQPPDGYFEQLMDLLRKHGTLLIFDEVITGFRYALGGAQEFFGVTPDLACFGKAMGNGMPISAVVGRADIMALMEDIFFSSTFGGEALSLAAAIAVIDTMRKEPVIETLWSTGRKLAEETEKLFVKHRLETVLCLVGQPPWKILTVKDHAKARKEAIRTLLLQEMLARGVLLLASHNVMAAHTANDIGHILSAYDASLAILARELDTGRLEERLGIPPIEPVFKVR
jgi:glutamate-1-semialdehyde 2,1-aminomutase/spore coat polysaccharide biosynthesis protein SpsF